jgi:hypothetical protein
VRINAYVLAADPTWLPQSVGAYYPYIGKLVVSYDVRSRGWTGAPTAVAECVGLLEALDVEGKIEWMPGDFSNPSAGSYMERETSQRQSALEVAARDADWILQIDTDEVLPDWSALRGVMDRAEASGVSAVEWPMRMLFRRLSRRRFLEVATISRTTHFEYPGPVAVRANAELMDARRANGEYLRPVVEGDTSSLQIRRLPAETEHRSVVLTPDQAIWHNSWARSPGITRRKIASWSHYEGLRSWVYYYTKWLPAPITWRALRRVHPFDRATLSLEEALWPRLQVAGDLPEALTG